MNITYLKISRTLIKVLKLQLLYLPVIKYVWLSQIQLSKILEMTLGHLNRIK